MDRLVEEEGLPERSVPAIELARSGWKLRNATYRNLAGMSANVASRELNEQVVAGVLQQQGSKRGAWYRPAEQWTPMVRVISREATDKYPRSPDPYLLLAAGEERLAPTLSLRNLLSVPRKNQGPLLQFRFTYYIYVVRNRLRKVDELARHGPANGVTYTDEDVEHWGQEADAGFPGWKFGKSGAGRSISVGVGAKPFALRLDAVRRAELDEVAAERQTTPSQVVRDLIDALWPGLCC